MCRRLLILVVVVFIATVSARADIMRFESDFTDWTGQDASSWSPVSSSTGHTPGGDGDWYATTTGGPSGWLTQGDIAGIPTTAKFYSASSGYRGRFRTDLPAEWVSNGLQDTGLRVDYGLYLAAGYLARRGSIQICFPTIHGMFDAYIRVQNGADPHTMIRPLRNGGSNYNEVDTLYLEDGDGNPRYIADEWHDWTVIVAYAYADGSDRAYWDLFLDGEQLLFGGSDGSPVLDGHTWSFRTPVGERDTYIGLAELDTSFPPFDFAFDYVNFANTPEPAPVAKASAPDPDDEEEDVDRDVTLSWSPGIYADKHDVYFGDNYNDVSDANRTNHPAGVVVSENQDANSYSVPELLDYGTTYYWKISEVNDPPTTIFEGKVWEFTTELFAYPITDVTATPSSEVSGKEAVNTVNESGLTDDLHSTDMSAMWLSGDEPTGAVIQYEFDRVYKLYEMWVWNYNGSGFNIISGFKDVTIEYSVDGSSWTPLAGVPQFAIATGEPNYAHNTTVPFGVTAKYVKLTATSKWSGDIITTQYGLSEVRFYRIPVRASRPEPTSGSTVTNLDGVQLKWRAGREAASHDVYLSDSTPPAYAGNVTVTNYPTGTLELGKTYYWQINEVNLAEVPDTWEGPVWNFSTPTYLNVEDMESYTDWASIRKVWKDGYAYSRWENEVPVWAPNGSNVNTSTDHPSGPGPKMGTQAMAYNYDNDGNTAVPGYEAWSYDANYFSEATAQTTGPNSLGFGTDFTKAGVRILSLQFYGDPGNDANDTEKLYVKLNNSRIEYDGDMADIQDASWHEWLIDLGQFGINLSNVTSMSIGFGDPTNINPGGTPGGDGVVYFDNIQLLPTGCHPERVKPLADIASATGVGTGNYDCRVDYWDLDAMVADWLASDYVIGDGEYRIPRAVPAPTLDGVTNSGQPPNIIRDEYNSIIRIIRDG